MPDNFRLKRWKDEIHKCVKCGTCTTLCPVYRILWQESVAPRGKMSLLEALIEGEIGPSRYLEGRLRQCLQCLKCVEGCPNAIPLEAILFSAWAHMSSILGFPFLRRLFFKTALLNQGALGLATRAMGIVGALFFQKQKTANLLRIRRPLQSLLPAALPALAPRPFRAGHPSKIFVKNPRTRVGFFTGCMVNAFQGSTGKAVLRLLEAARAEVVIPRGQTCCGTPFLSLGLPEIALELARVNIAAFDAEKVEAIISCCASCTSTLKRKYSHLLGDEAERFSNLVQDISVFLSPDNIEGAAASGRKRIYYHDPCHHKRGLGIAAEPRRLIASVPGTEIMPSHDLCCGFGGVFHLDFRSLSLQIGEALIDAIIEDPPDVVVTGCPACVYQISAGLARADIPTPVKHLAEFIAQQIQWR